MLFVNNMSVSVNWAKSGCKFSIIIMDYQNDTIL